MGKLTVFDFITLDGYYKDINEGISWNKHGAEEGEFSAERLKARHTLLFGRVTYEMMASYWPTPMALQNPSVVVEGMNNADKIVFSKTLKKADWNNTKIINGNIIEEIKKLKQLPGKDMTVLGSGSIVTQFAEQNLIDEYQIMIFPIAIGDGFSILKGMKHQLELKLVSSKIFKSSSVILTYQPK